MNICHFGSIRLRVVGFGDLKLTLFSYNDLNSDVQTPLSLNSTNSIAPTVLSNFTEMKAKLEGKVTEIGEYFEISEIIVYAKVTGTSFPQ